MSDEALDVVDEIGWCDKDPLRYALFAYDWGHGELRGSTGPRTWQRAVMNDIKGHLSCPDTRYQPLMIAVASGHGIGKSALVSMLINWGISTCSDAKIVITANTESQLRTKTWPEVRKWHEASINKSWFTATATGLVSSDAGHESTWRCDAVTWSEHNTEAFAGLHNVGRRIIVIFDEASSIADKVWEVAKGALTDQNTEIIWLAFGNPTRNTGAFRNCFSSQRHRWKTYQIDSRDVEGTNQELFAQWAADYGEDSDFFKVRVRGIFPSMSAKQFISVQDVDAAFGKHLRPEQYNWAPKILTCDPAWQGDDDLVIGLRQGLAFQVLRVMPKNDNDVQVATTIAHLEDEHDADAVFIDAGYGTGIVSVGTTMGRDWQLVWFGGASNDPGCLNKRAEMWKEMRDWLKSGGAIPQDNVLYQDLIGPEAVPRLDGKFQLESKDAMKQRGLPSPNRADALALSFAFPVAKKIDGFRNGYESANARDDYDPFAR